jgi:hypothetical protein
MPPTEIETRPARRLRFQIRDVLALVVGYGLAALFFRAFWPARGLSSAVLAPAAALYVWLGLALSGPILLLRRPAADLPADPAPLPNAGSNTWAEWAWLFVGCYWIVLGLVVIPARLRMFGAGDALVFGIVPIAAGLGFRLIGAEAAAAARRTTNWTHPAAVVLLLSWPLAWGCMVFIGRGLK